MKNFYGRELARVTEKMESTNPSTEEYGRLLFACERLDTLRRYAEEVEYQKEVDDVTQEELPGQLTVDELPAQKVEEEPVKEETPLPWVDSNPFPDVPVTDAPKELTREYVRSLLRDATMRGVTIAPILQQFVPEGKPFKFSEVPASKYAELVEVLNNA